MGTQTMTETTTGATCMGWARTETDIGVVVKRSAGVHVAFSDQYTSKKGATVIGVTMSPADAIEFARAVIAAATGVDCYEDEYEFQATKDARKIAEASE
tara:strand:+ start:1713 stop:2009 length:297 start_codon:yes stop_codon:yes gene_type:complete